MAIYAIDGRRPSIAATAWVAPSADVIGEVRLEADASVWFGAVVRADNTLIAVGRGSNVQEGAMLHSDPGVPCTVGADCTIGHHAILHGCTLGDRVLVGMGAVVLNRAAIGDDCLIGAGALVTEGKRFEAGQLIVGAPAAAKRALSAEEIALLHGSARGYVEKARAFAERLEPAG